MVCFFAFTRGRALCRCRSGAAGAWVLHPCAWHPKAPLLAGCSGTAPRPVLLLGLHSIPQGRVGSSPFPKPSMQTPRSALMQPYLPRKAPQRSEVSYRRGAKRCLLLCREVTAAPLSVQRCSPRPGHGAHLPEEHTAFPFLPFSPNFPIFFPPSPPFFTLLLRWHHSAAGCLQWQSPPWGQDFPHGYTNCPCGHRISPRGYQVSPLRIKFSSWL